MLTRAAVLYDTTKPRPYATSQPLVIEEVELDGPGEGEALVEIAGAGLCHSDLSAINGAIPRPVPRHLGLPGPVPVILGHEASGIVREVGPGVNDLTPGDHVVFSFVPMCGHCKYCATGRPVLCVKGAKANLAGTLLHNTIPFHKDGGPVLPYLGAAAFSQFTVAAQESLVKIDPAVPLDKAALFGCAILTGVGAVINTAKVRPGESVVVFGLGGVGLSAVMGAKLAGAGPIIAVDTQPAKFDLARRVGSDHTINALDGDPVKAIKSLTGGGTDYAFEAVGNARVLTQAYEATQRGGTTVAIGMAPPTQHFSIQASNLTYMEKSLLGSFMGSAVPRRDIPRYIGLYMSGRLPVDELVSQRLPLEEINAGFDRLDDGATVRQIIKF